MLSLVFSGGKISHQNITRLLCPFSSLAQVILAYQNLV